MPPAAALPAAAPAASAAPRADAAPAPRTAADPKRAELRARLERRLARLSDELDGIAGYVARDLVAGESFERNADAVFPAASVIKLPVFLELLRQAEEGTLDLSRPVPIDPAARVEGGGVLEKWSEPYPALSAWQLAVLMMDFSDNYATNLLIDLVGMERVGRRLRGWGLRETLLRRKMLDLEAARAGRENVSTPREMAALLERLQRGQILDAGGTARALAVMKRNEGTPMRRGLPPGVEAADKNGELEGVRCGAGIVFVPGRPFVLAVMTTYLMDDAAGEAYVSEVARAVHDHFAALARSSEHGRAIGRP
jgi:beta-lactamase class A